MSVDQASNTEDFVIVYVKLLGEGTDVWRPVRASHQGSDLYKLSKVDGIQDPDEVWEFPIGSVVRCSVKLLGSSTLPSEQLVAVSLS